MTLTHSQLYEQQPKMLASVKRNVKQENAFPLHRITKTRLRWRSSPPPHFGIAMETRIFPDSLVFVLETELLSNIHFECATCLRLLLTWLPKSDLRVPQVLTFFLHRSHSRLHVLAVAMCIIMFFCIILFYVGWSYEIFSSIPNEEQY